VLPQQRLIRRVIELSHADERLVAVLHCGSFVEGEGDEWSDIDFWLCVEDAALGDFDSREWISRVAPLLTCLRNEFGTDVAIFAGLIRGEFHFEAASRMAEVRSWPVREETLDVDAMVVLDRTGELRDHLSAMADTPNERLAAARVQELQDRFLNWFVFGVNVLLRGDDARALDILSHVDRHLLWLARSRAGKVGRHYLTPSKLAAQDLSAAHYRRYVACTAALDAIDLRRAYREAWAWFRELARETCPELGTEVPGPLQGELEVRVAELG
jgi:lincosamide nucleotidyltransferase